MDIIIEHFSVDNIKWFEDHEEMDIFKCDILYDGKKIGEFSEDYMNGPDIYDLDTDKMEKLREVANRFFRTYSKDEDLVTNRFSNNEDFFIRFLRNLKEAIDESENSEGIEISTTYPFNYLMCTNVKTKKNCFFRGDEEHQLFFPVGPFKTNIVIPKKENEDNHELI